jgi:hypothetical protein
MTPAFGVPAARVAHATGSLVPFCWYRLVVDALTAVDGP